MPPLRSVINDTMDYEYNAMRHDLTVGVRGGRGKGNFVRYCGIPDYLRSAVSF